MAIVSHDVGDLFLQSMPHPYPPQPWWITGRQRSQQLSCLRDPGAGGSSARTHAQKASLGGDLFPVSAVSLTCAVPHTGPRDVKSSSEAARRKVSVNYFPFCQLKLNLCVSPRTGKSRRWLGALLCSDSNSLIRVKDTWMWRQESHHPQTLWTHTHTHTHPSQ